MSPYAKCPHPGHFVSLLHDKCRLPLLQIILKSYPQEQKILNTSVSFLNDGLQVVLYARHVLFTRHGQGKKDGFCNGISRETASTCNITQRTRFVGNSIRRHTGTWHVKSSAVAFANPISISKNNLCAMSLYRFL